MKTIKNKEYWDGYIGVDFAVGCMFSCAIFIFIPTAIIIQMGTSIFLTILAAITFVVGFAFAIGRCVIMMQVIYPIWNSKRQIIYNKTDARRIGDKIAIALIFGKLEKVS